MRVQQDLGSDPSRVLEFFIERPAEPTFSQERNHLHAVEVTTDCVCVCV